MLPEERRDGRQARPKQTEKAAFEREKWFHLLWYELRYGASDVSMWKALCVSFQAHGDWG